MPQYKLTYFQVQALAEPIRFLFSYGKKDFEDCRISNEEWPKHKPNYPLGKLPALEVEGKTYGQTIAICRFVAKEVGLAGKNALEDLEIDGIVDSIVDIRLAVFNAYMEKNPESKESKKTQILNETYPTFLNFLEAKAKENNGYLALNRLTWADVVFACYSNLFSRASEMDVLKDKPNLKALVEKVNNLPGIKEYIAQRPETTF